MDGRLNQIVYKKHTRFLGRIYRSKKLILNWSQWWRTSRLGFVPNDRIMGREFSDPELAYTFFFIAHRIEKVIVFAVLHNSMICDYWMCI